MINTKTWIFGTTSELSKKIISNVEEPILFGRHNVYGRGFVTQQTVDGRFVDLNINVLYNENVILL